MKERARRVCAQSVRAGRTTARNLNDDVSVHHGEDARVHATYLIWLCSVDKAMFSMQPNSLRIKSQIPRNACYGEESDANTNALRCDAMRSRWM